MTDDKHIQRDEPRPGRTDRTVDPSAETLYRENDRWLPRDGLFVPDYKHERPQRNT